MTKNNAKHPELLQAIESSQFLLPELPGKLSRLQLAGLLGRVTTSNDDFANMVGAARLSCATVQARIEQVHQQYTNPERCYSWITGPLSLPRELPQWLEKAGMEKQLEEAGMALTDLKAPVPANPNVKIRLANPSDLKPAARMLAPALSIQLEAAQIAVEALMLSPAPLRRQVYLAYMPESEDPAGFACLVHIPYLPVAVLFLAATSLEQRGRGIYSSLVARRLADAHRDGAQAAIIQAVRTSSAPICKKMGFVELCNLDWYSWQLGMPWHNA